MCLVGGGIGKGLREKFITMILSGKHRGPDSFGVWTNEGFLKSMDFSDLDGIPDGDIGLFQCRLGMTGSKSYTQPFFNDLVLVHNGEIYNHSQLRTFLEGKGVEFESDVDSEVILRLLENMLGEGLSIEGAAARAMRMLEGDYAVGISDGERIHLFRDPIGIRPLYYSPNGFFASEKKVLWAVGEEAIPVSPGELVTISENGIERKKLFDVLELRGKTLSHDHALKALKSSLEYSVRIRCGKKTGVLFSGGLDSSIVALLASKYSDVILYTAGMEGSQDLEWARKASELLGLELREYVFTEDEVEEELPRIAFTIEEPNPMNLAIGIPLYFATRLAGKDGVKVLLSGQGADELFGGYAKYLERPELMEEDIINLSERNLARDDKIAMLNGVEGRYPFLSMPVVWTALNIPLELKISGGVRKAILRKLALKLGLPAEIASREKKAAQYGSGAQKALERIAKRRGTSLRGLAEALFSEAFEG
ncbi:asparagine synthase [Thermococcus profundus]|uniref:Putative asparagine synthetase [glutamine-hydrolyzing] n=1 Tax=Thermococcus profundus TaxID=49899 RepID=A0A2Z2MC72_THEPR|nr:asparagine synthase (glutamine-hydrolyzing) [Thermococcus profundus]ASJ02282.1 asparagine synthase [Thermococcus profundus]